MVPLVVQPGLADVKRSYLVRRVLLVIPTMVAIVVVTFGVIQFAPGDPEVTFSSSESATPEFLTSLRTKWGLDRPVTEQFLVYAGNVLRGDLGESYDGQRVNHVIAQRLWPTLLLTGTALIIGCLLGIGLGVTTARRAFRAVDLLVRTVALLAYALPVFFVAQLAILFFVVRWNIFPLQGMQDLRVERVGLDHALDLVHHLLLPALVLAVSEVAILARLTRTRLLEELSTQYVRTARAKGMVEDRVVLCHALPNAILPVLTVIGSRAGFLIAGAAVVENIFSWPGLGSLLVESATAGNRPVMLGMVILIAFTIVLANLFTDLLCARIDPRVRFH